MERVGSDKVFETDCMKSFIHQLSLYGFSKARQNVLISLCLNNLLTEELPVCVLSKVRAGEYLLGPGSGVCTNLRTARDGGRPAGKAVCKDRTEDWCMGPGGSRWGEGFMCPNNSLVAQT